MAGGKTGSNETTVRLDPRMEEGAAGVLVQALNAAALPYRPNRGVTIAGFTPQQQAAFEGANMAAGAFGLPVAAASPMPETETAAGGIQGYSTGALYDQMVDQSLSDEDKAARENILAEYGRLADRVAGMDGFRRGGGK